MHNTIQYVNILVLSCTVSLQDGTPRALAWTPEASDATVAQRFSQGLRNVGRASLGPRDLEAVQRRRRSSGAASSAPASTRATLTPRASAEEHLAAVEVNVAPRALALVPPQWGVLQPAEALEAAAARAAVLALHLAEDESGLGVFVPPSAVWAVDWPEGGRLPAAVADALSDPARLVVACNALC